MTAVNPIELNLKDNGLSDKVRIHIDEPMASGWFCHELSRRLMGHAVNKTRPVILLCIGTDRSTGDCLGPLVGSKMSTSGQEFFKVFGTLDQPVHASNLGGKLKEIQDNYQDPFIIALDACLGNLDNVGCITIGDGSLQPGAGVNKRLPPVGHIHITGIVNVGGFMEYIVLQNTRLNIVMRIADTIVKGFHDTIALYNGNEFQKEAQEI
ncbi:MAG: spore protease YyaC [Firmicutes bacterium]|nr:spore protease YyaC [Bacillota bacterium]